MSRLKIQRHPSYWQVLDSWWLQTAKARVEAQGGEMAEICKTVLILGLKF